MSNWKEWYCTKCRLVYQTGVAQPRHCGQDAVLFDLPTHGRELIGFSNAWIALNKKKWKSHPYYLEAQAEFFDSGNASESGIVNLFVEKLIERAHG